MERRFVAFDLDGTLTQHKTPLGEENRAVLDALREKYTLVMVGAGSCERIHKQMGGYPIDVIGNYGMQTSHWDASEGRLVIEETVTAPVDREEILRRAAAIRDRFDLHTFAGETMEFHATGMLTFPVLGTKAVQADKLAYDPDRAKRRVMYPFVKELFSDYHVMIGGSSSFDIVPGAYGKANALRRYLRAHGAEDGAVTYCGDDYMPGGNDADVLEAGFDFVKVDDYTRLRDFVTAHGLL